MSFQQKSTATSNTETTSNAQDPPHSTSTDTANSSTSHSQATGQASQSGQSPLDWTNFMNFQTPPVTGSSGNNGGMRTGGYTSGDAQQFQNFAQGVAMRGSPPNITFNHYSTGTSQNGNQNHGQSQGGSSRGSYVAPSPLQHQLPLPSHPQPTRTGSSHGRSEPSQPINKGKSVAESRQNDNVDNGLTLDPAAFTRDIRFQVPPFLSNQMGGAPSFPAGGEAWSGFSGANFFGDGSAMGGPLTPGSLFSQSFGFGGNNDHNNQYGNDASRGPLDGLSGFMNGENWDSWSGDVKKDNNTGLTPFYVNPNPSPSILSSRHQQQQQQQQSSTGSMDPPRQASGSYQAKSNGNTTIPQSPRTTRPIPSPRPSNVAKLNLSSSNQSDATVPPSAIFSNQSVSTFGQSNSNNPAVYHSSLSEPNASGQASTINIASSSTQPYAPPANTQALLQGPQLPSGMSAPTLADGPGLYSTTGFDMVGVLSRVAARRDPKTVLGPVDLSCSFLVVDIRRYDSPIVYASPTFTALTGYDLPQILGRNCRFLQSPDGEVVKGSKRKYTDNVAVAHLKRMLNAGKECQASLINYRRGGIPFINLVTVVPIPWEGTDIVYHVGFQVDLVEQPNAILRNMRDGSYTINYTVANPPQPPLAPTGNTNTTGTGLSGLTQEVLEIMGSKVLTANGGDDGGKTEWLKMVLENADDFVHVLSLKGLFQYVSPSVRRVLEYDPEDLINKNISDICHPSDIVPLMRELKDSTHAPSEGQTARTVNLVFRIRRKSSGYVWIECTGRLHVEAGKGRKAVILSGRARSVPTLPWDNVARNGGLAEDEFWVKSSYQGLILHATSGVNEVLGYSTEDVVGKSLFSYLPTSDDGPPSVLVVNSDPHSIAVNLHNTLLSGCSGGLGGTGVISTRLRFIRKNGLPVDVQVIIYSPTSVVTSPILPRSDSDDSSPDSDSPSPTSLTHTTNPSTLVIQIKVLSQNQSRPIVHAPSANVFEELETTRGTSWQYELHQLRLLNRRLKDDIAAARSRGGEAGKKGLKGKNKRKAEDGQGGGEATQGGNAGSGGNGNGNGNGGMGPPQNTMDRFAAAPPHQLAPGFGLVQPGIGSSYY